MRAACNSALDGWMDERWMEGWMHEEEEGTGVLSD